MNTIYNFKNWISESKLINFSLWVSNLTEKDPSLLDIIDEYIEDKDPTIGLENLLDTLNSSQKENLRKRIEDKLSKDSPKQVTTSIQSIDPIRQKTLFKLFVKTLSFIDGIEVEKKPKRDWLVYFTTKKIWREKLLNLSTRITSINQEVEKIPGDQKWVKAFWGVKNDGLFCYGFYTKSEFYPIQEVKFTGNFSRYISSLGAKILWEIKRDFMEVTPQNLLLLGKIKTSVDEFDFPSSDKFSLWEKHLLHFSWYGLGVWSSREIDTSSFEKIKEEIKEKLRSYRWSNKVKISLRAEEFWIHLYIQIKQ
jgi:hypothetical protein